MTWHPTDDDLILLFYGECAPEDADRAHKHIAECEVCEAAWIDLQETLKLVDAANVPEPGPAFERTTWARVAEALPTEPASRWRFSWMLPLGAAAAVVVAAVVTVKYWQGAPATVAPTVAHTSGTPLRERVLLSALDDHFDQAQTLLVELMNAPDATDAADVGPDLAFVRTAADDLVADSRLYRMTARQNGDVRMVRLLDDLELVLVDVARTPERMEPADLQSLRARITDANLLFKVRAASNEVKDREKRAATE